MSVIATHAFAFVPSCIVLELRTPELGYSMYSYARAGKWRSGGWRLFGLATATYRNSLSLPRKLCRLQTLNVKAERIGANRVVALTLFQDRTSSVIDGA